MKSELFDVICKKCGSKEIRITSDSVMTRMIETDINLDCKNCHATETLSM